MTDNVTIADAFEVLQAAIETAITEAQDTGSDAMRQGDFDSAEKVIQQARKLDALREQLRTLQHGFEQHVIEAAEPDVNHTRLRQGLKTPQDAYRVPILEALVEMGGSANLNDVLEHVYNKMKPHLNDHDHAPLPSDQNTPRWRNTAQWARNQLRSEGLLKGDSPRGTWGISDEGRAWLASKGG
ncbi:MAG: winged helix-turn-helix domain-containing protein [Chloroflexota bacterium]